jgi:hypothetical protein
MSDSLDRITSFPSTLALAGGENAGRDRVLTVCIVVLLVGLARGASGIAYTCLAAMPVWSTAAAMFDILLIMFYVISRDNNNAMKMPVDTGGWLFTIVNIPLAMALFTIVIDFLFSFFAMGFWKDTIVLSAFVLVQILLVKSLRRLTRFTGSPESTFTKAMVNGVKGLISSTGACIFGFAAFLLFHVGAQSLLSDKLVTSIEELASSIMEGVEHPFGARHPGFQLWLIFVLLFVLAGLLGRSRLTSKLIAGRRLESILETALLAFICFSLTSSQIEQFGITRETELGQRAAERTEVAKELQRVVRERPLLASDKAILGDALKEIEDARDSEDVAIKAISNVEKGRFSEDTVSDSYSRQTFADEKYGLILPASSSGRSRLLEMRSKRVQEEARAEAAANALQELLTETSSTILGSVFKDNSRLTDLLISAVSDFISDNSEYSLTAVCARVLGVFSGKEKPLDPSFSTVPALIEKSETEVRREHEAASHSKGGEGKEEVEPASHPVL